MSSGACSPHTAAAARHFFCALPLILSRTTSACTCTSGLILPHRYAGTVPSPPAPPEAATARPRLASTDGCPVQMIDSTRRREEPLTLELGVGEIVGNPLVQALEQAVRSHGVGDLVELQLKGGDYKPELVFKVPTDHPEITRLQGRYKSYAPCHPRTQSLLCLRPTFMRFRQGEGEGGKLLSVLPTAHLCPPPGPSPSARRCRATQADALSQELRMSSMLRWETRWVARWPSCRWESGPCFLRYLSGL